MPDVDLPYRKWCYARFFFVKTQAIKCNFFELQIWDIAGDAVEGRMFDKYAYGANAIMLIYDVTNGKSFENLETWLKASHKVTAAMENQPIRWDCSMYVITIDIFWEYIPN